MDRRHACFALALGLMVAAPLRAADEVHYEVKDGVTYLVTTRTTPRRISEIIYKDQERPKATTDAKPVTRNYPVPVTEWVAEPYLEGRWNPFVEPYWAYRYVPVTRWETRTEAYKVQATQTQLVPEKKTVKVPVRQQRIVEDQTITRVVVQSPPPSSTPVVSVNLSPGAGSAASTASRGRGDDLLK